MATSRQGNQDWKLEHFLDALIVELDKAQDTLSVKGLTRRLTYTVKDLALDLHIFPVYDRGSVRFRTAAPNEAGSSRLSFQLGSITDRQIRDTTSDPITEDDISIDGIEEVDPEVREGLRRVGVRSARDLERLSRRGIAIDKVMAERTPDRRVDYGELASMINRARRRTRSPGVHAVSMGRSPDEWVLQGTNLFVPDWSDDAHFPLAQLNDRPVPVTRAGPTEMRLSVPDGALRRGPNRLTVALDPYAVMTLNVNTAEMA